MENQNTTRKSRSIGLISGLALAGGAYAFVLRPRLLNWGASPKEVKHAFPGAELIPGGKRTPTMATTLDAPPQEVWPWLVQMGCHQAGWYSWDLLDNAGKPSATRIHQEWQNLSLGDRLWATRDGRFWFEVAALEAPHFLGLRASVDLGQGRPYSPQGPRPTHYLDTLWGFQLLELPGERTRLIVSGYASSHPRWLQAVSEFLFWEPAHWIMQTRQFNNLQRRVTAARARA